MSLLAPTKDKSMKIFLIALLLPLQLFASKFATAPIITNGNMALSSVTSVGVDLNQINLSSMQAYWTGSPVGSLKVQVSTDNVPLGLGADPASNVVHWTDYTGSSVAISAAGDQLYNMTFVGYRWARLVYTKTSGAGTINATYNGKGLQ